MRRHTLRPWCYRHPRLAWALFWSIGWLEILLQGLFGLWEGMMEGVENLRIEYREMSRELRG